MCVSVLWSAAPARTRERVPADGTGRVQPHWRPPECLHSKEPKGGHLEEPALGQGVDECFPFSQSLVASCVRQTPLFHRQSRWPS